MHSLSSIKRANVSEPYPDEISWICHKKKVALVDHNEKDQAVDNIEKAEIVEIIDHHKLGSLETMTPISFRNQPVGCTATILYEMYGEQKLEISPTIAGLLCAAIISIR